MGIVKTIHNLAEHQNTRKACRYIYAEMERLADAGAYQEIDDILLKLNVDDLHNSILVAVLTSTSWCYENLQNRKIFCDRVKNKIELENPGTAEEVLYGLC